MSPRRQEPITALLRSQIILATEPVIMSVTKRLREKISRMFGRGVVQHFYAPVSVIQTGVQSVATVLQGQAYSQEEGRLTQEDLNRLIALYRERLTEFVNSVRLFGEAGPRSLDKVFVELKLVDQYERPPLNYKWSEVIAAEVKYKTDIFATAPVETFGGKEKQTVKPDKLLLKKISTVIASAPGSGKTTLLKYLTWKALSDNQGLPVFLELKSLTGNLFSKTEGSFAELLFNEGVSRFLNLNQAERRLFRDHFLKCLQDHEVIIFIDGLDEVSGSEFFEALCQSVNGFLRSTYSNNLVIISTRPYALQTRFEGLREMEIAPLNNRQIREFLVHYFGDAPIATRLPPQLRHRSELRELARIPFLLGVIAYLYQQPEPFTESRLELYRQIVQQLTVKLDREKAVERFNIDDDGSLKKDFLKYLAFELLLGEDKKEGVERIVFSDEYILRAAKSFCRGTEIHPYLLSADVKATPMLREIGADVFTFAHLTLQEYLAAKALCERDDYEKVFCRAFFDTTVVEMEVLPMFFGLTSNPDALYTLLDQLPESLIFTNLRLQARSLTYLQTDNGSARLESLTERLIEFINEEVDEETPYRWALLASYATARSPFSDYIVNKVAALLKSEHQQVRDRAIHALGEFSGDLVVDILIGALKDNRKGVRRRAVIELGSIGDERAVAALLNTLHDEDVYIRDVAVSALGHIGDEKAVDGLIEALREKEHDRGEHAAAALGRIGGKKVLEALLRALKDSDVNVRYYAIEALRDLGEDGASGLIVALGDKSEFNRATAIKWLAWLKSEEAVEPIFNSLRDEGNDVGKAAVEALTSIGGESVIQRSITLLKDGDSHVRQNCAEILGELKDERAIQHLAAILHDHDHGVRVAAVDAIRMIEGEAAVRELLKALENEHSDVRSQAAMWLGVIGGVEAIRPLIRVIKDENASVRGDAAWALILLGGKQAVDFLMDHLDPSDSAYWFLAERIGPAGGEKVLDWLVRALESGDLNLRASAASSLAKFKEDKAVDALVKALSDEEWIVRERAAKSLGKIGSKRAIAGLTEALKDEEFWVSEVAASALGNIGDEEAVDALIELLNADRRNCTVWDAERALTMIGGVRAVRALLVASAVNPRNDYRRLADLINEYDKGRASDGLIEILKHGDHQIRLSAIKELGEIDDDWAQEALCHAREDEDLEIRCLASSVLENRLGQSEKDETKEQPKPLRTRTEDVRSEIRKHVEASAGARVVKDLLYLLRSEDEYVRGDAAKALAGLDGKSISEGLIEALSDDDVFTRQKAAQVLAYYVEDATVREPLSRLANDDPVDIVRLAAHESIRKLEFKLKVA